MNANTIKRASRKALEKAGFSFVWGSSVYECCVRYNSEWIGTWRTTRRNAIPREEIINQLGIGEE
jgi:hypothetical protein